MGTGDSSQETLRISVDKRTIDIALGKLVAVVVLGAVLGYVVSLASSGAADEVSADGTETPMAVSLVFGVFTCGIVAGIYELLGRGFGWIIGRVRRTLGS